MFLLYNNFARKTTVYYEAMQKAQQETGKVLNIGVINRFNNGANKIKELIDSGELGEVYHIYMSFRGMFLKLATNYEGLRFRQYVGRPSEI